MTGTSILTEGMKDAITAGFNNVSATVTDVTLIAVPVMVGVVALTAGVNYAIGKVRSVVSAAV